MHMTLISTFSFFIIAFRAGMTKVNFLPIDGTSRILYVRVTLSTTTLRGWKRERAYV